MDTRPPTGAEILAHPSPVDDTEALVWPVEGDPLLDDIDDLVEQISSGAYYEGFGWDDEIHDRRSFGDEVPILAASLKRRMPGYRKLGFTESDRPRGS